MKPVITATVLLSIICSSAHADFVCRSDISYKWKKHAPKSNQAVSAKGAEVKGKDSEKSDPAASEPQTLEIEVFYKAVEKKALTEEESKSGLNEIIQEAKALAAKACSADHQNTTSCIAGKYSTMSSMIGALGFSARKNVEEAIKSDCEALQGICITTIASEAKCVEVKAPVAVEEKPAETGKKEEKSKKK